MCRLLPIVAQRGQNLTRKDCQTERVFGRESHRFTCARQYFRQRECDSPFWLRQGPCLRCNRQAACSVCPWSRTPQWLTYKFSNILVTREIGRYGVLSMWFITRSSVKTDLNCNEWVSGLTGSWRRCCQRSSWQRRRGRPGRSWTWLLPLLRVLS